jgi:hypothetical protein
MAADYQFYQTTGATPGVDTPQGIGNGSNDWDFKSNGDPGKATAADTIRAGDYSYHIYVRGRFTQPASGVQFSSITNVKYYGSNINLSGYGNGSAIYASGTTVYAEPSNTGMSGVWDPIPQVSASGVDISTSDLAAGTPGWTDWVAIQLKTGAINAGTGFQSFQQFTIIYDEV